jgi:hypothetical protein
LLQLSQHDIQRDAASLEEHQKMIEEIGRLGRETFVVLRICRDYHLHCLLAYLLRSLAHPAGQQFRRIRALGLFRCP